MAVLKHHISESTRKEPRSIPGQISMMNEIRRKLIHISSIMIPILYWFLTQEQMLWMLVPATSIAVIIEVLRRTFAGFEKWFQSLFGALLRPHESSDRPEINGATYVLVSATLCVLLFPKIVAITGFSVLIISDTASALYGRRFGKRKFLRKSVEGSAAFFVTAMMVVLVVAWLVDAPWEFIAAGAVASLIATIVEAVSHGGGSIDDNLTIPAAFSVVMWGLLAFVEGLSLHTLLLVP